MGNAGRRLVALGATLSLMAAGAIAGVGVGAAASATSNGAASSTTLTAPAAKVVRNTAPVIYGAYKVTVLQGSTFEPLQGVTATDAQDGNLTKYIQVSGSVDTAKPGLYILTYRVTDSGGLSTSVIRTVTVKAIPNARPVIDGATAVTITVGDAFDPKEGVKAFDLEDGDLTSKVVIDGNVDTTKPGTYNLFYSVTDSAGQTARVSRTVTVEANEDAPVIEGVDDVTVKEGTPFDALQGVTAKSATGEDLTELIDVVGDVDIDIPGQYTYTYTVTDEENELTTTVIRTITVEPWIQPSLRLTKDIKALSTKGVAVGDTFINVTRIEDPDNVIAATSDGEDGDEWLVRFNIYQTTDKTPSCVPANLVEGSPFEEEVAGSGVVKATATAPATTMWMHWQVQLVRVDPDDDSEKVVDAGPCGGQYQTSEVRSADVRFVNHALHGQGSCEDVDLDGKCGAGDYAVFTWVREWQGINVAAPTHTFSTVPAGELELDPATADDDDVVVQYSRHLITDKDVARKNLSVQGTYKTQYGSSSLLKSYTKSLQLG